MKLLKPSYNRPAGGLMSTAAAVLACALGGCTAMSSSDELRFPCDGEASWDPNVPLFLHFDTEGSVPTRTPAFAEDLRVFTADNKEVEVFVADIGDGNVVICPDGGLEPSTEYFWIAGPFSSDSRNMATRSFESSQLRSFTTDDTSDNAPITSWSACSGVKADVYELLECDTDIQDTGDTGQ